MLVIWPMMRTAHLDHHLGLALASPTRSSTSGRYLPSHQRRRPPCPPSAAILQQTACPPLSVEPRARNPLARGAYLSAPPWKMSRVRAQPVPFWICRGAPVSKVMLSTANDHRPPPLQQALLARRHPPYQPNAAASFDWSPDEAIPPCRLSRVLYLTQHYLHRSTRHYRHQCMSKTSITMVQRRRSIARLLVPLGKLSLGRIQSIPKSQSTARKAKLERQRLLSIITMILKRRTDPKTWTLTQSLMRTTRSPSYHLTRRPLLISNPRLTTHRGSHGNLSAPIRTP